MNSIESNFLPYQIAIDMKSIGFDEPCLVYYNKKELFSFAQICNEPLKGHYIKMSNRLCAPTFSQAFRWFRQEHQLEGEVHCIRFNSKRLKGYQYAITSKNYQSFEQLGDYNTYEEAELACIDKLIQIVKQKL